MSIRLGLNLDFVLTDASGTLNASCVFVGTLVNNLTVLTP